ncbi:hypothetical protein M0R45_031630 [Rubus argutus]|uniref:Uncharacterized protein n=1 Tax=Rubus argutus TaxID=59490 RepID=A0AAW1WEJ9_RUBAR
MADALISFLVEQLASTAFEQMKEKVRLISDVENEVDQLTKSLKKIQAVLKDAEKRQVKEAVVQEWLDELKEVAYEMDNVLDEWNTEALKLQIEKQEHEGESSLFIKKKVRFSMPSPSNCFCFGQGSRRIVVRHDIAQTIKVLNSRLTKIAEDRDKYQFQSTTSGIEQPQRPKTSPLVDFAFGREDEKHTLISMLLGYSTSTNTVEEERGPLVIPVVGMGGMGKTTLAQLVYNDVGVYHHFDERRWVCVSDPFDEIEIAKTIISDHDTPNSDKFYDPMQSVSKSFLGKRFLVVLDDVWTEDGNKWERLKGALMGGYRGSRILVTTQKMTVARMMGATTTHMIHLGMLSERDCLSIFNNIAFLDRKEDKFHLFGAIGNKIVKKCNGLPLAAKTLGSLMRYKNTIKEWQVVLDSQIWELEVVEKQIFHPLLLSYYDLTPKIRSCLLFCASFPKDCEIDKENLIELWMSQNYLSSNRNIEKRAIGEEYFDDLVMRSFFQDFKKDDYGNLRSCKMHDIVHDFVQFLTRNECLIIEANGANQAIEKLSNESVHHLTLMLAADDPLSLPVPFRTLKKLRSLTIFNKERVTTIDGNLILKLKCLRTLNLRDSNVRDVPKEIGELLHLRYIDLSSNWGLKELPDAMCNLCNLETLHLEFCLRLEKLPKAMGKLINLKHLYLNGCDDLRGLPKGVGRLRGLRILDRFVCGGGDDKEILELGDLGSFEHLQGTLQISIEKLGNVKDAREQAQKAQLEKKKHLLHLALDFGENSRDQQRISDEEVLDALRPHPDLKSLIVWYYNGSGTLVFGNWIMSLQHLTHLTLQWFSYCESLPPLGKLPYLEVLNIRSMRRVKKVGVELLGIEETQTSPATATPTAFPKLKQLEFGSMANWEEWEGVGDYCQVIIMPCLSSLFIDGAPELKQLPNFLYYIPQLQMKVDHVHPSLVEYLARWS